MACGLWVLKPEYLTASQEAGHWVEEEAYEWTDAETKNNIDGKSIRRLRLEGGKVFEGAKYDHPLDYYYYYYYYYYY